MDFKVKVVGLGKAEDKQKCFTVGKIYDVKNGTIYTDQGDCYYSWACSPYRDDGFEALQDWWRQWYKFELVEGTKVFSKKDLETGVFGLMSDGVGNFVVVDNKLIYQNGGCAWIRDLNSDLELAGCKILVLYKNCVSFDCLDSYLDSHPEHVVYDRDGRDSTRKMTLSEIEEALGYKVKIVEEEE